ncbi:MAG: hypothetical protein J5643_01070 [Lachnospiraceae bacterium]|nr:hypothetical protein [Lachnospiraceae bacterium]
MKDHEKEPKKGSPKPRRERYEKTSGGKLCFIVFMFWLLAVGAAFLGSLIQFQDLKPTGVVKSGSLFSGEYYDFEGLNYILGAAVFLILFGILWFLIMRGMFRPIRRSSKFVQFLCVVISLAGVVGIFFVTLWVDLQHLGLSDGIRHQVFEAFTLFGWSVVAFVRACVGGVMGIREEKRAKFGKPQ